MPMHYLNMFEKSFADIFIAKREVRAPSIIFIDSGWTKKSVSDRGPTVRARVVVNNRIPVTSATNATAAATAAAAATTSSNTGEFPRWS